MVGGCWQKPLTKNNQPSTKNNQLTTINQKLKHHVKIYKRSHGEYGGYRDLPHHLPPHFLYLFCHSFLVGVYS